MKRIILILVLAVSATSKADLIVNPIDIVVSVSPKAQEILRQENRGIKVWLALEADFGRGTNPRTPFAIDTLHFAPEGGMKKSRAHNATEELRLRRGAGHFSYVAVEGNSEPDPRRWNSVTCQEAVYNRSQVKTLNKIRIRCKANTEL